MTLCFSRYIFIGSRLGDSVLLEYKSVHRNRHCLPDTSAEDDSQPPSKKPLILNEDDEFLYGFDETLASTGVDAVIKK
jgi:hypothetical protein